MRKGSYADEGRAYLRLHECKEAGKHVTKEKKDTLCVGILYTVPILRYNPHT